MVVLVVVAVVERDGGGRLRRDLAVVVMVILGRTGHCLSRWRWRRRRRERRLGRRSRWRRRLSVQTQVLVLLAQPVKLDLQLFNSAPLGFQKLLLALDDVVEFKKVLHGPVRAFWAALAWALISFHG